MTKNKSRLPYIYYFTPVCLLSLAGFCASVYLAISHYKVYTDIDYSSFCAISRAINCDTVSQSPYAILMGMPLSVWGAAGYCFLMLILPYTHNKDERKHLWSFFFIIVLFYSLYSIYLAGISTFYIHSYCLMCIFTYGINFALMFYSWIIIKRFNPDGTIKGLVSDICFIRQNKNRIVPVVFVFFILSGCVWFSFDDYWNLKIENSLTEIPRGMTEEGHSWIGAEKPELVIYEYTDYLCFQCKKMHYYLRSLVARNQTKIRLVHRHFPLDQKYNAYIKENLHSGAGEMAMLAIYAGLKDRFWEMNDTLFSLNRSSGVIDLKSIAEKTGINSSELAWALGSTEIRLLLKKDIAFGVKVGVSGTPTYEINGQAFAGNIPPEIFKKYTVIPP